MTSFYRIESAKDLPNAIQFASGEGAGSKFRWYVARMAKAYGKSDLIPGDWDVDVSSAAFRVRSEAELQQNSRVDEAVDALVDTAGKVIDGEVEVEQAAQQAEAVMASAARAGIEVEVSRAWSNGLDVLVADGSLTEEQHEALVAAVGKVAGKIIKKVQTLAGVRRYGAPIGTPIVADPKTGKLKADVTRIPKTDEDKVTQLKRKVEVASKALADAREGNTAARGYEARQREVRNAENDLRRAETELRGLQPRDFSADRMDPRQSKVVRTPAEDIAEGDELQYKVSGGKATSRVVEKVTPRDDGGFDLVVSDSEGNETKHTLPKGAQLRKVFDKDETPDHERRGTPEERLKRDIDGIKAEKQRAKSEGVDKEAHRDSLVDVDMAKTGTPALKSHLPSHERAEIAKKVEEKAPKGTNLDDKTPIKRGEKAFGVKYTDADGNASEGVYWSDGPKGSQAWITVKDPETGRNAFRLVEEQGGKIVEVKGGAPTRRLPSRQEAAAAQDLLDKSKGWVAYNSALQQVENIRSEFKSANGTKFQRDRLAAAEERAEKLRPEGEQPDLDALEDAQNIVAYHAFARAEMGSSKPKLGRNPSKAGLQKFAPNSEMTDDENVDVEWSLFDDSPEVQERATKVKAAQAEAETKRAADRKRIDAAGAELREARKRVTDAREKSSAHREGLWTGKFKSTPESIEARQEFFKEVIKGLDAGERLLDILEETGEESPDLRGEWTDRKKINEQREQARAELAALDKERAALPKSAPADEPEPEKPALTQENRNEITDTREVDGVEERVRRSGTIERGDYLIVPTKDGKFQVMENFGSYRLNKATFATEALARKRADRLTKQEADRKAKQAPKPETKPAASTADEPKRTPGQKMRAAEMALIDGDADKAATLAREAAQEAMNEAETADLKRREELAGIAEEAAEIARDADKSGTSAGTKRDAQSAELYAKEAGKRATTLRDDEIDDEPDAPETPEPVKADAPDESDPWDADITIEHTPDGGTIVHGTEKGSPAVQVLKDNGFRWSRNLGSWYQPRTRDQRPDQAKIDRTAAALEKAGFSVGKAIDNDRRSAADREAAKAERADERAEALSNKADRRARDAEIADQRRKAADARVPEGGEPIKVGHHSEQRHRNAIEKSFKALGKSVEADREAKRAAERADTAAKATDRRHSPDTVKNRISKLEADIRRDERALNGHTRNFRDGKGEIYSSDVTPPATGARKEQIEQRLADARDDLDYWKGIRDQQVAEGKTTNFSAEDFKPGQFVVSGSNVYRIKKVNKKTLTVETEGYQSGVRTAKVDIDKVRSAPSDPEAIRETLAKSVAKLSDEDLKSRVGYNRGVLSYGVRDAMKAELARREGKPAPDPEMPIPDLEQPKSKATKPAPESATPTPSEPAQRVTTAPETPAPEVPESTGGAFVPDMSGYNADQREEMRKHIERADAVKAAAEALAALPATPDHYYERKKLIDDLQRAKRMHTANPYTLGLYDDTPVARARKKNLQRVDRERKAPTVSTKLGARPTSVTDDMVKFASIEEIGSHAKDVREEWARRLTPEQRRERLTQIGANPVMTSTKVGDQTNRKNLGRLRETLIEVNRVESTPKRNPAEVSDREVLEMLVGEHLSTTEIAQALGIPKKDVYKRLSRLRDGQYIYSMENGDTEAEYAGRNIRDGGGAIAKPVSGDRSRIEDLWWTAGFDDDGSATAALKRWDEQEAAADRQRIARAKDRAGAGETNLPTRPTRNNPTGAPARRTNGAGTSVPRNAPAAEKAQAKTETPPAEKTAAPTPESTGAAPAAPAAALTDADGDPVGVGSEGFRLGQGYQRWRVSKVNDNGTVDLEPVGEGRRNRIGVDPSRLKKHDASAPANRSVEATPTLTTASDAGLYTVGRGGKKWRIASVNTDGSVNLVGESGEGRQRWSVARSKLREVSSQAPRGAATGGSLGTDSLGNEVSRDKTYRLGRGSQVWRVDKVNEDGTLDLAPVGGDRSRKRLAIDPARLKATDAPAPRRGRPRKDRSAETATMRERLDSIKARAETRKSDADAQSEKMDKAVKDMLNPDTPSADTSNVLTDRVFNALSGVHRRKIAALEGKANLSEDERNELSTHRAALNRLRAEYGLAPVTSE